MNALRDRIGRINARVRPGAGGFFAWWSRALAAWLPVRWRAALGLGRDRLLLSQEPDALTLRLQTVDGMQGPVLRDVGRLPAGEDLGIDADPLAVVLAPAIVDLPRWLVMPAAAGLRRRMTLPAAAAERLRDVVSFEIDRQTPFTAQTAAFDARILDRRAADGQLEVELVVVPLTSIQPRLDALGGIASTLAGVDLSDGSGAPIGVNLLPPAQRRHRADPFATWHWVFGAVALIALGAGLWQVLDNRRAAADAFETDVNARSAQARTAAMRRQRLVDAVDGQTFLDQSRNGRPSAIEVLDELTRRLPDTTYLEKVAIENDRLTLIGLSSEASSLVGRLEGSRLWRAPALTGALQPDPRSGRDRFTLTAELAVNAPQVQNRQEPARAAAAE
ncbi:type II secretion system protein L [Lysobacter helvus]|uniref:Type II secretion system protein L n=2 Tax=Lysobacteraceae TaxID=32033 RepID=A0ABM7Q3I6_9GAMM|nr:MULTISPECIES: PilN domain-containing protein [Lysobacter]BCT91804.1 type II secretion system protein L [Lysobacter caseinilyticus]BCT94957.1 type II secretion system protein L [Lysobacter helvus]